MVSVNGKSFVSSFSKTSLSAPRYRSCKAKRAEKQRAHSGHMWHGPARSLTYARTHIVSALGGKASLPLRTGGNIPTRTAVS